MAGELSANIWAPSSNPHLSLYNPTSLHSQSLKSLFCKYSSSSFRISPLLRMAASLDEPSPKIPKLHEHGVSKLSSNGVSFFRVKKLSDKAVLPSRASSLSAGYDLSSASEVKVLAREKALVPTDLSIAIPEGTYARIVPRSGLAWKHSIDVGAGVIDADYRGPIGVILFNHSDNDFEVKIGDRIAQLIIEKIMTPDVVEVEDLDSTVRGHGGFGSTGANVVHIARRRSCKSRNRKQFQNLMYEKKRYVEAIKASKKFP